MFASSLAFIMLVGLFSIGFFNLAIAVRQDEYRPLGNYPLQIVGNPRNADGMPEVTAGGLLLVTAIKCNNSNHEIPFVGNANWVIEMPVRRSVPYTSNTLGERKVGCVETQYENLVPKELEPGEWYLAGREVVGETVPLFSWWDYPVKVTQTKTWRTELFRVVKP